MRYWRARGPARAADRPQGVECAMLTRAMSRYIVTVARSMRIPMSHRETSIPMVQPSHQPEEFDRRRRRGRPERNPEVRLHELLHPLRLGRAMVRRGVRTAILAVLADQPMHGYQVIQELESRSGGRWRPSAGSVYPTLQLLEDERLVRSEEVDGRRVYTITEEGRAAVANSPLSRPPWVDADNPAKATDMRKLIADLAGAAIQVSRAGNPQTQAHAREILVA